MYKIILIIVAFILVSPVSLLSSLDKWLPINKKLSAVDLNSSTVTTDNKIFAVGEYGTIKVTDMTGEYSITRGDFSLANLNDISYDGNSTLLAVGEKSSLVISEDNGQSWTDIKTETIDNFKSVAFFKNSFFVSSDNAIYEYKPNTSQFKLITNDYSGINKLHSTTEYVYAIGQQGLLLQYSDSEFKQLTINTTENISEIISRGSKIIIFPNKEYAILTEDNFVTTSRFITENNLFFIKSSAWINDSLIISIGSKDILPPYYHSYSDNLLQSFNIGSYPYPPQKSLKGFGDKAIITAERGTIVYIVNSGTFDPNFSMFNSFLTLESENKSLPILSLKGKTLYAFATNFIHFQIDIERLEIEPYFNDIKRITDAILFNNSYYILTSLEKLENGAMHYLNYVLKLSDNNIDTVFMNDEYIRFKFTKIEEINNRLLIYSNGPEIYINNVDDDNFEEIKLTGNVRDLFIHDNKIYCILMNDQYKRYLVKSTDFGETFEELLFFDYLTNISIYEDKIYLLTTSFGTGVTRFHTVYRYNNDVPEKIYEFTSKAPIIRFHAYDDLLLLVDMANTVFSTDGGDTWTHESFGNIGGAIYGVVAYENKVIMSKGNFLYYRMFDLATSVTDETDELQYKLFPNPTSDYIEITQPFDVYIVQIYDILGVEVLSTPSAAHPPLREGNLRIDVSALAPGMYFIRIGNQIQKFIKL